MEFKKSGKSKDGGTALAVKNLEIDKEYYLVYVSTKEGVGKHNGKLHNFYEAVNGDDAFSWDESKNFGIFGCKILDDELEDAVPGQAVRIIYRGIPKGTNFHMIDFTNGDIVKLSSESA